MATVPPSHDSGDQRVHCVPLSKQLLAVYGNVEYAHPSGWRIYMGRSTAYLIDTD